MAQGSTEWLKLREKKVTGTSLTRVRGAKWLEYADVIVRERVTGERKSNEFKSFSMDNGHVLEPFASTAYEEFRKYKVTEVGFLQSEQFENFGMSPDGVIFIDGNVIGVAEIKCPEPQTHIKYIRQDKIPTEYDDQILSAFVVGDEVQFVDFVSFCPVVRSYPFFIKRAKRADYEHEIASARGALIKFFEQVDKMEQIVLDGNGFVPSNLEDAIWEVAEPEELIYDEDLIRHDETPAVDDVWVGFTPPISTPWDLQPVNGTISTSNIPANTNDNNTNNYLL
jgi:hypothetical protein